MDRFRLDSVAARAAERFRLATENQRRAAARIACERAVAGAGLSGTDVSEALAVLRGGAVPVGSLRERLETMVTAFDDDYWRLDEAGEERGEAHRCFSKARAASALGLGTRAR